MRNFYKLFCLLAITLIGGLFESFAQPVIITPYPAPAQAITRGLNTGLLTVRVAFPSACANDTVTIQLPESVTYISGSVAKTAGSYAIAEADISNLRTPRFEITGVTGAGDITFTISRQAACGSGANGKDTVIVEGSCGSTTENGGSVNTYNLLAPSLSLTPPASINSAVVGGTYTRNITVTNGGNGDADTAFFYIVYPGGGIVNTASDQITVGGNSFSPSSTSGDTFFYKIFGATLFGGDNLLTNGESFTVTEPIRLVICNTQTSYGVGWGVSGTEVCDWTTGTGAISMSSGVPRLTTMSVSRIGYVDRCTPFDVELVITNGGLGNDTAGTMFNLKVDFAESNGNWFTGYQTAFIGFSNPRVNGNSITSFSTTGGIATIDLTDQFTTDPDGPGGLEDIDGDGYFDDLRRGSALTYRMLMTLNCNRVCGQDIDYTPGGHVRYDNMCGVANTSGNLSSGGGSGGIAITEDQYSGTSYTPSNVNGGTPFTFEFKEGHYRTSSSFDNSNTRYRWKLILPAGVTVSGTGNPTYAGVAASYTQVADSLYIVSPSNSLRDASIDLVYTCGGGGNITFEYELDKINDITTGCECQGQLICGTLVTRFFCPSPCPAGPTTYIPVVRRTDGSLGWTNSSMTTKQSAGSISAYDLSKALYLDTIQITGTAVQNSSVNNLHLEMNITRSGTTNRLEPLEIVTRIFRSGALLTTYTISTYTDNSSGGSQITEWDLSSGLPAGAMLPGDSIHTVSRYVVSTNSTLPLNDIQTGSTWHFYSLIGGVREGCNNPIPEMYLVGTNSVDGRNAWRASGCNNVSDDAANIARRFNTSGQLFQNEYRPVFYVDSFVVTYPNTYAIGTVLSNFVPGSSVTPDKVDGLVHTFINPGTWTTVPLTITNTYGAHIDFPMVPSCKTTNGLVHNVKFYIKDYYYALADRSPYPSTYIYVQGGGTSNTGGAPGGKSSGISYTAVNSPILVTQNLTGDVVGSQVQHSWDIEVRNDGLSTAPNLWVALEELPGTGISIDSVTLVSSGARLTANSYGTGKTWYEVSTPGVAPAGTESVRVFFKYTKCTPDSIRASWGWNCSSYPSPNPDADTNACSITSVFAKVVPVKSQIQISITRQPGGGSPISLCATDSVLVQVNSAQDANVLTPILEIYPPTGVTVPSPLLVQYPYGTGTYEAIATTVIPGGYSIDLSNHSALATDGIPGLIANPGAAGRQAKVKVDFTTDCNLSSGSAFTFVPKGVDPCGETSNGDGIPSRSGGVNITGGGTTGIMGLNITLPSDSFTCGTSTLTLSSTAVITASQPGDTVEYTLPEGLAYAGNFQNVANCGSCNATSVAGPANSTIVKVALAAGTSVGTPMEFSFDVNCTPTGGCGNNLITAEAKRQIPALTCTPPSGPAFVCPNSSAVIGSRSEPIRILRPEWNWTSFTGVYLEDSADHTYSVRGTLSNDATDFNLPAGNDVVVEYYRDENSNGMFDGADLLLGSKTFDYGWNAGQSQSLWASVNNVTSPDPSKGIFAVIDAATSPNCNCNAASVAPMITGLPVDITEFDVTLIGEDAHLYWSTASERDNDRFEILRKVDGESEFVKVGEVRGAGNSNELVSYNYIDNLSGKQGNVLYKLRQVDFNGNASTSDVRIVQLSNELGHKVTIFPNPTKDKVRIEIPGLTTTFHYRLVDALGKVVVTANAKSGEEIDFSQVAVGTYFIQVYQGDLLLNNSSLVIE